MKKVIAIVVSVLLIVSLLPMAAFAKAPTEEIVAKVTGAREYLYGDKETFTAADGYDFYFYIISGGDTAPYKDAYIQSVKDAFDAGSMNTADRVGIAANCLMWLGEDTDAFELNDGSKINLEEKIMECGTTVDSPYNYYFVLTQAYDEAYKAQVFEALEANYTKGSGYDYWGFSADNTANFGAIETSFYGNQELVEDAVEVMEQYKTDKGYYYNAEYGTDANGNSTASALYFYALLRDFEKADEAYAMLTDNFGKDDGGYAYALGGDSDRYATRDAFKALVMYLWVEEEEEPENPEPIEDEPEDIAEGEEDVAAVPATGAEQKQSTPATGDSAAALCVAGTAMLALGVTLALRKKEEA